MANLTSIVYRRKKLKLFETTKLFYGEYLYKLSVKNRLSAIFRERNLSYARQVLDKLQHEYENGQRLYLYQGSREKPITEENFQDAKRLFNYFSRFDDYKLRVESQTLSIYANDIKWLEKISGEIDPYNIESMHKPDPKFVEKLESNIILVNTNSGYQYKVTLGGNRGNPEFANWAERNPKLIRLGSITKKALLEQGYINGMYFYARDERTLQLCNLMLSNIRRIDKLVVKQDIDK